jgi:hypothetical protein
MSDANQDAPSLLVRQCSSCQHYLEQKTGVIGEQHGLCRRFPPELQFTQTPLGQTGITSMFPPVTADTYCGEFRAAFATLPSISLLSKKQPQ